MNDVNQLVNIAQIVKPQPATNVSVINARLKLWGERIGLIKVTPLEKLRREAIVTGLSIDEYLKQYHPVSSWHDRRQS